MPVTVPPALAIRSRRPRRLGLWIALGIAVVVLLILAAAPVPQDGSTYERSPTGYRTWYETMRQQGVPVQRWQRNYQQLQGTGQTLIQIWGGRSTPPSGWDQNQIQAWVAKGNTLITLAWNGPVTDAPFASQLSSPVGPVLIETRRRYLAKAGADIQVQLEDQVGVVVWTQSLNRGQWVQATYPWLAANVYEGQSANYQFLKTLATQQQGTIWIDEWLHGHRDPIAATGSGPSARNTTIYEFLWQTPLSAIAAQAVLVLLLLIWGGNLRFGPLLDLKPPVVDNSEQYIQALGGVLNNAGHTDFVLQHLGQRLRQQLAQALDLTLDPRQNGSLPEDTLLANQWAAHTGRQPQELLEVLQQTTQNRRLSDRELLAWVGKAAAILEMP